MISADLFLAKIPPRIEVLIGRSRPYQVRWYATTDRLIRGQVKTVAVLHRRAFKSEANAQKFLKELQ